jgi:hypothetical protein
LALKQVTRIHHERNCAEPTLPLELRLRSLSRVQRSEPHHPPVPPVKRTAVSAVNWDYKLARTRQLEEFEMVLNEHGAEGWECRESLPGHILFKRPIN